MLTVFTHRAAETASSYIFLRLSVVMALGLAGWVPGAFCQIGADSQHVIAKELTITSIRLVPPAIEFESVADFDPPKDRIAVAIGATFVGIVESPTAVSGTGKYSVSLRIPPGTDPNGRTRGWLLRRDYISQLAETWPSEVPQLSTIDSVGPGGDSVWIRAGALAGIRVGQSWWRRVNGQPHMRFDVRLVADELCHCRCVRLAAGAHIESGDAVELWPGPGQVREGRLRTAVSFIDAAHDDPFVWLPRVKPSLCPADTRFDFYRGGNYVGYGMAERSDERFWYVRLLKQAGTGPLQVGDDAICRTFQDAAAGRTRGRVFAKSKEGWLATAGEAEGLKPGQTATAYRQDRLLGTVEIRRVQEAYCTTSDVFAPASAGSAAAVTAERPALQLLDEIRFGSQAQSRDQIGSIATISPVGLVTVSVSKSPPPLNRALLIESAGRPIGVATLFGVESGIAFGLVVEESLLAPVQVGQIMRLPN